jgi:hypothetical protein
MSTQKTSFERAPVRLRRGWIVETFDAQAPGAGRSSDSFWHEIGWQGERDCCW